MADTPSVSNDAATSPPTIFGTIPCKQQGYNLNPAEGGNLFLSHKREDAVLFHNRDSKNPARELVAHHETDTEGELCDSPAIAARDIQQADGVPVVAQVQPTAAEQIPSVPCCEPDIPSALLTGEALAGHNAFVQSRWEEFYSDDTEDDINGWPKSRHHWSKGLSATYHWSYWHDPYNET
jgi:hypothetical protein